MLVREAEGDLTHIERRRRYEAAGLGGWREGAVGRAALAGVRSWKRQGTDSPVELLEGEWPHCHLDFDPMALILASRTMGEYLSVVGAHQVCGGPLWQL